MGKSRTKNTLINASYAILARVIAMIFGFVQKTIFIRVLGISYAGVSGLFTDILMLLSLAELGMGTAISYSLYKPIAENDYKRIGQLMNFFKRAYEIIAATVLGIGLCIVPFVKYLVKDVPDITESIELIFLLYIINTAATYLLVYKNTLLVAAQKQYIVSNVQTIFTMVSIVIQCIALLVFKNFILYLLIQILFALIQNLTINIIATKTYPQLKQYCREKLEKEEKKRLFGDIRALMIYKVANVVTSSTDSSIISASLGTGQVGILGNYRTVRGYATSMIAQFYNALNPSLGNLAATEGEERQYEIFKRLEFGTFWLSAFCATSFYILFNPFIRLWLGNENWILPMSTLAVFVIEFYISNQLHSVGAFRIANGLFVQTKYLTLVRALLNLGISIVLVKPLGILGVLLGTVFSYLLTQLWYEPMVLYREVFKKSVWKYYIQFAGYALLTVLCCILISGAMALIPSLNPWLELLIRAMLCLVVVNGVIVIVFHKTKEYKECVLLVKKISHSFMNKIPFIKKRIVK